MKNQINLICALCCLFLFCLPADGQVKEYSVTMYTEKFVNWGYLEDNRLFLVEPDSIYRVLDSIVYSNDSLRSLGSNGKVSYEVTIDTLGNIIELKLDGCYPQLTLNALNEIGQYLFSLENVNRPFKKNGEADKPEIIEEFSLRLSILDGQPVLHFGFDGVVMPPNCRGLTRSRRK